MPPQEVSKSPTEIASLCHLLVLLATLAPAPQVQVSDGDRFPLPLDAMGALCLVELNVQVSDGDRFPLPRTSTRSRAVTLPEDVQVSDGDRFPLPPVGPRRASADRQHGSKSPTEIASLCHRHPPRHPRPSRQSPSLRRRSLPSATATFSCRSARFATSPSLRRRSLPSATLDRVTECVLAPICIQPVTQGAQLTTRYCAHDRSNFLANLRRNSVSRAFF